MIGEKLKYYRMIQGLTQRDVAYCAGLRPAAIGQLEIRKGCKVHLDTAIKVSRALGVSIDQLVSPLTEQEKEKMREANQKMYSKRIGRLSNSMKRLYQ